MSHKLRTARSPERSEGHTPSGPTPRSERSEGESSSGHTVRVQARSVYGVQRIYPKNYAARSFCALTGRKTLLEDHLTLIENLGFKIEWIPETAGSVPDDEG
jgi:hypothetical protein